MLDDNRSKMFCREEENWEWWWVLGDYEKPP